MATKSMKCDIKASAMAAGILWGAGIFGLGLMSTATGGGRAVAGDSVFQRWICNE